MDQTRQPRLFQSKSLLDTLPSSLATSKIDLSTFQVDPEEVNDYGYTGAVNRNRALEITFGWEGHSSGDQLTPCPLTGCGQVFLWGDFLIR